MNQKEEKTESSKTSIDWVGKLKNLAKSNDLENESLNPEVLLEISSRQVQFLKKTNQAELNAEDQELKQAMEDIEVLAILFQTVANSTVNSLDKTKSKIDSIDKNIKKDTTGLLSFNKEKERIQNQIKSLEETAEASGIDFSEEIKPLQASLKELEEKNQSNRSSVKQLHQNKKNLESEFSDLKKTMNGARGEQLLLALNELQRIRKNRCVSQAILSEEKGKLWLEVKLHPIVLEDRGNNYYIEALHFKVAITNKSQLQIKWIFDTNHPATAWSPHPHIFPNQENAGAACWGDAWSPIKDALSRHELSTAIRYITGWASQCRDDEHREALRKNFLKTSLEPGWHPELTCWPEV